MFIVTRYQRVLGEIAGMSTQSGVSKHGRVIHVS